MASLLYSSYFKKYQENAWLLRTEEEEHGDPGSHFLKTLSGTWVQILQQAPSFLKQPILGTCSTTHDPLTLPRRFFH